MSELLFDFLRFSMNGTPVPEGGFRGMDWRGLWAFARKQALEGVVFRGVSRLPRELAPPREMLLSWLALSERVRKRNLLLNGETVRVCSRLEADGFRCCVLKGQGNALLYPDVYERMPGDIDIWVWPEDTAGGKGNGGPDLGRWRQRVIRYVHGFTRETELRYHHVSFTSSKGIPIELHFLPCIMNAWSYRRRLRRWFDSQAEGQFAHRVALPDGAGEICVPTVAFNRVYQLAHVYHHFFDEGVGLRQLMDYYYVLLWEEPEDREAEARLLRHLGLYGFAGAVMYVLHEVFGLEEGRMTVPADVRRGRMLMGEVLDGGNFGQSFSRYGHFTRRGTGAKYFLKIYRNLHFLRLYPAEALSEPLFRTWQWMWRKERKLCNGQ